MPPPGSIPSQIPSRLVPFPVSPSNPAATAPHPPAMLRSPSAAIKPPCRAFQSHPSDLELVDSYLRPWVETGVKTGAFIHDAYVYAADPAGLTRQFAPAVAGDGERAWYFYTPLRHKSVHGKRKTRTVATGGGCWHNEAKSKPVYMVSNGKQHQIGHRQSFSFVKKDTGVRVRTGWLMIELRLLKDGAGQEPEAEEDGALGNRVLCKVYRSPRNPEPSGSGAAAAAASPGHKAEADDDESSDATLDGDYDDDDSSNASLEAASGPKRRKSDDVESSEATVAAPSRHSKANDEISGGAAAAPGRKEKAEVGEDSVETSAAAPPRKRKALDDESSGAAGAPARKKKADGSSSPGAPVSATEMQCPQCGTHLVVTLKRAESKSETAIAKDESASGAPQRGETRGSSQKNVRFHQFL
ncbi:NAC domain-containing protein 67-like [Miscanthus floridulus]|uniref:NAC domain-containing protein 67-like n=1 Tax=Miscanthus floridulus TaxID=154761 RepID=UPI003457B7BB